MDNQTKLSTEDILKELEKGNVVETNEIDFVERDAQLIQLSRNITEKYESYFQFATACGVSPSHLNDFLKNKKQFSRDKLISICIALGYDIKATRQTLHGLGNTDLYSRKRRDFEILSCIQQGKNLDETNEILQRNGLEPLSGTGARS